MFNVMMLFIEIGTRYTPVVYYKRNRKKKKTWRRQWLVPKKCSSTPTTIRYYLKKQESEIKSVSFIILGFFIYLQLIFS